MSEEPFKPLGEPISLVASDVWKFGQKDIDRAVKKASRTLKPFLNAKPYRNVPTN